MLFAYILTKFHGPSRLPFKNKDTEEQQGKVKAAKDTQSPLYSPYSNFQDEFPGGCSWGAWSTPSHPPKLSWNQPLVYKPAKARPPQLDLVIKPSD